MRKIILMLLLAVLSNSAMARWVAVSQIGDENGSITIYADPATIQKAGNMVKMWSMHDRNIAAKGSNRKLHLSAKSQDEFDCKEEQIRTISFFVYPKNMGRGKAVSSGSNLNKNWKHVPPGSVLETLWKIACGKQGDGATPRVE